MEGGDPHIDTFPVEDPVQTDLTHFVHGVDSRQSVYRWRERPSDTYGCICLHDPAVLEASCSLSSKDCPSLCLMDALLSDGWRMVHRAVTHLPTDTDLICDGRRLFSKRHYMQALLARASIWGFGVESFRSDWTENYFWLLLHNKHEGVTPKNIRKRVNELNKDRAELVGLERSSKVRRTRPGEGEIVGGVELDAGEIIGDGEVPDAHEELCEIVGEGGVYADDDDGIELVGGGDLPAPYEPPKFICGRPVTIETRDNEVSVGLRVKCSRHPRCTKYCSLKKQLHGYGERYPEFALGVWLSLEIPAPEHRRNPTKAEIDEFYLSTL